MFASLLLHFFPLFLFFVGHFSNCAAGTQPTRTLFFCTVILHGWCKVKIMDNNILFLVNTYHEQPFGEKYKHKASLNAFGSWWVSSLWPYSPCLDKQTALTHTPPQSFSAETCLRWNTGQKPFLPVLGAPVWIWWAPCRAQSYSLPERTRIL